MKPLLKYLRNEYRWRLGLGLTLLVIGLLIWNIKLTIQLQSTLEQSSSNVTGYSTKRLDTMWMKINSMEQLLHTVPLVECGDWNERRKSK